MTTDPFRIPADPRIAEAERKLNFRVPPAYIEFLKGGGNIANAVLDAAVILPGCSYPDLFDIAETAWNHDGIPKDWLPLIQDNGDYFCISKNGEERYWSHNGTANERWLSFSAWFQQVCVERK
ncbi:MAG: SMI1/KNR4 family protein [Iodobacter sp.]